MGVRALQLVQDVTRKYCITVEHCYFGQLVFSVLSTEQVEKGSSDSSLSLLQTSRDEQIVGGSYQVTGKLVPQQYVQFLFREGEIQQTSNMRTKRTSPHQYLSPVTGGMRDMGEFVIKTDSIFHHSAVKNSASGA